LAQAGVGARGGVGSGLDDFAKRVIEARARTGKVIRCSPAGGGGTVTIDEALKLLRPGMILRLAQGKYPRRDIGTRRITLEAEDDVTADISLRGDDCVVRGIQGRSIQVRLTPTEGESVSSCFVDSQMMEFNVAGDSRLYVFNSLLQCPKFSKGVEALFRHCTFLKTGHRGLLEVTGDARRLVLEDCLMAVPERAIIQLRTADLRTPVSVIVECVRSALYSEVGLGLRRWDQDRQYTPFSATGDDSIFRLSNCVTSMTKVVLFDSSPYPTYSLAATSPGKGIAAGGRDPGALLDEKGNLLPLDPALPAAP
jgi:hypothetical protein